MSPAVRKKRVRHLCDVLDGLTNDARYYDLCRTYGDYSAETLSHLEHCREIQARVENHT